MMHHIWINSTKGEAKNVLVMLHGTGGNERSMIPIAQALDVDAPIIIVRGNVDENGVNRYFRRYEDGSFDIQDLKFRTHELMDFVNESLKSHDLTDLNTIAVGYSNGANIAASALYHSADFLQGAILFNAMVPLEVDKMPDLTGVKIFLVAGENDPYIPFEQSQELQATLEAAGADVTFYSHQAGHVLTQDALNAAVDWYRNKFGR